MFLEEVYDTMVCRQFMVPISEEKGLRFKLTDDLVRE